MASASGPKNSARVRTGISNPLRVFCFGSPERTSDFFFRPAIGFSPSAAVISRACYDERRGRDSNPRDDGKVVRTTVYLDQGCESCAPGPPARGPGPFGLSGTPSTAILHLPAFWILPRRQRVSSATVARSLLRSRKWRKSWRLADVPTVMVCPLTNAHTTPGG